MGVHRYEVSFGQHLVRMVQLKEPRKGDISQYLIDMVLRLMDRLTSLSVWWLVFGRPKKNPNRGQEC